MKNVIAMIICAVLCVSILTACSNTGNTADSTPDSKKSAVELLHPFTVRAPKSYGEMTATFMNAASGDKTQIEMTATEEDDKYNIYSCEADVNKYNMVHLTSNGRDSMEIAFNSFISGWNVKNDELLPYDVGTEPIYDPQFETKVFQFDGRI